MASQRFARPIFDNPFLKIQELPGNTVKRNSESLKKANCDPKGTSLVVTRDVDLDTTKNTWLRLYVPRRLTKNPTPKKLPLIMYYHGGGFVYFHANTFIFDVFCQALAERVGAMVISLEYRLAPEHRLPAAYDDAMDGLEWLKTTKDEWVCNYADLSKVFLGGTSSGGNLAYNTGLRAAAMAKELEPIKIKGLILHHPFFSGKNRTESEEKQKDDQLLPLHAVDKMFDLCLPKGVDHDHEYCNPCANGGSKHLDDMKELGWKVFVSGACEDPLVDAARGCVRLMEEKGLKVFKFFRDGYHAMEVFDQSMAAALYDAAKDFVYAASRT
ncbi:probable carboxylesterase 120 [Solanum stenotomum]|uniref:probable carboxylesterase 120 n=1 Tax=Solanum stenotomum TaxID=172797 RepID=UPI0020D17A91|nr:probable carboxylesterase 120 [Solanum stenotomum]